MNGPFLLNGILRREATEFYFSIFHVHPHPSPLDNKNNVSRLLEEQIENKKIGKIQENQKI